MTLLGGAVLGAAAFLIQRLYSSYLAARREDCLGFLALLRELERGISLYLDSPAAVAERLGDDVLCRSCFIKRLREGVPPAAAFSEAAPSLSLPADAGRLLEEYFSRFGVGHADGELSALRRTISELEPIAERERESASRRGRVAGVLLFSATVGLLILLL